MNLKFEACNTTHIATLIWISKKTFSDAFEKANKPEDFAAYSNHAFNKEKLLTELNNPNTAFYFVYLNSELVGYFKLNEFDAQSEAQPDDAIELERIYVLEKFQGKQIGFHILEAIKTKIIGKEKKMLWLGVWEENYAAIRFYKKHGFIEFGTHPYYVGTDKQTDLLLKIEMIH